MPPHARKTRCVDASSGVPVARPGPRRSGRRPAPKTGGSDVPIRRKLTLTIALAAITAVTIPAIFAIVPGAFAADGPTADASVVHMANFRAADTKIVHRRF